jgi:hypothetical protein
MLELMKCSASSAPGSPARTAARRSKSVPRVGGPLAVLDLVPDSNGHGGRHWTLVALSHTVSEMPNDKALAMLRQQAKDVSGARIDSGYCAAEENQQATAAARLEFFATL